VGRDFGREWVGVSAGVFSGIRPWFHASNDAQSRFNNILDPQQHGYDGSLPKAGNMGAKLRISLGVPR
jgi:hypothetical protein